MKLILNEQEVIDGVCVFVAEYFGCEPQQVEVDLHFRNGRFSANGETVFGDTLRMNQQDIIDGIAMFLKEYHHFNPDFMSVQLNFHEGQGIWAEVIVAE
jgi:hypothetical protein